MLKSYEAIYDHGKIEWLGEVPRFNQARVVLVADDANELESPNKPEKRGSSLLDETTKIQLSDSQASALLTETAGAWGNRSLADIDAMLFEQRRQDW
jgi:hypothetical protein